MFIDARPQMRTPDKRFRITVDGTSLFIYCEFEIVALIEGRKLAKLMPGRPVLIVQLEPEYRVVEECTSDV